MNPKRNRNRYHYQQTEKEVDVPAVVKFVKINTKKNITIREHYLYLDDVKTAININTLEERYKTKLMLLELLKKSRNQDTLIQKLEQSAELDRHRLIKLL
jgi:uncharacterized protein YerC